MVDSHWLSILHIIAYALYMYTKKEIATYFSILAWNPMGREALRGLKESDTTEHAQRSCQ